MKNMQPFTLLFGARVGLLMLCGALFGPGYTLAQTPTDDGTQADQCVDADLISKKDDCPGGGSTGEVNFMAMITGSGGQMCCPDNPGVTSVRCTLLNNASMQVGTPISIPVANLGDTFSFENLAPGTYKLLLRAVVNNSVCGENEIDAFVTIAAAPAVQLQEGTSQDETCPGSADGLIQVRATTGTPDFDISLVNPPFTFSNTGLNSFVQFQNLGAGTYTITATDANMCTASLSVTLDIQNPGGLTVTPSITPVTCPGGNDGAVTLSVSGGMSPYDFDWSNSNSTTNTASNLIAGAFTVTVTDDDGCEKVTQGLVIQPPPFSLQTEKSDACNGENTGAIDLTVSGGNGGYTFVWSGPDGFSSTQQNISGLAPGSNPGYRVTVTDDEGCTAASNAVDVLEREPLVLILPTVDPVISGDNQPLLFDVSPNSGRILWTITDTANVRTDVLGSLSGNSGSNSQVTVNKTYTLTNARSLGAVVFTAAPYYGNASNPVCPGEPQTLTVIVRPSGDAGIFIPEIYTPNGDGENDDWQVVLPSDATDGEVVIFNRLGGKVYNGSLDTPWNGNACPDGTYFYVITYQQGGAEQVRKGAVTILRTND